tara:strand:- start:102 stop:326 length:225 start_codon:yes stop_codon:yes gene_type:complete
MEAHHPTRREMELKDYIEKRGEESLAKELKVSVSTIRSWRYNTRQPSVNQAKKLIKMTGHALDWESIYGAVEES